MRFYETLISIFKRKNNNMGTIQTLVCVKQVKQERSDQWDESMPLPGDIVEGVAEEGADDRLFVPAKARSELSSQLGKISRQADAVWLKVRRGDGTVKLRVCVVPDRSSKMQKRFTFRAASSERHVAVLADLTFEQCTELQEMSRRVVNVESRGFNQKGVKYEWKKKVDTYLPDQRSTVVSSILFMPLPTEYTIDGTTVRTMAWFSAAVSSGIPLVFINIQTEQIITSEKSSNVTGKEITLGRQQSFTTTVQIVQGIRLWFLPGIAEISLELTPEPGDARFGMDIKRTDEGFVCVYSVTEGSPADRAGLGHLYEQARKTGQRLVLSRLEGKSLMPSTVSSAGLIHCCDHGDIKETLISAMDQMDTIQVHVMSWPNKTPPSAPHSIGAATLRPPN